MAVFLPTNASRECTPSLGDFVSKTEEIGSFLRNGKDFEMVEEKGSGIQKEDVVISRTRNDDVMAAEARECSHSYGEMQTEEMVFSHGGLKGPHSCTEVPKKGMVSSRSGMKDPHVYATKGLHLYSEMPKEDMVSSQNGITGAHLHHRKGPHSCTETSKDDMVSSQTASDDIVASDGVENTHTCGTEGSHSHNERQQQGMVSQNNIEISHSYGIEGSHPYSKTQLSDDDVTDTQNAHSHSIEAPPSYHEGQKEDMVAESGIGNTHPYGTEGSQPYVIERSHSSSDKILKKPGKLLPCPRCESLDTKFCYFNNYNVNQPRHFCRKCQRYWTAGGSLRNLPVGAGRRKNKHVSHQKHAKPSDIHLHVSKSGSDEIASGSQLSFSSSPLSQNHASLTAMGSTSTTVDVVSNQSSPYVDSNANLSTTGIYRGVVSEQSSFSDCGDAGVKWERGLTNNLKKAPIAESSRSNDAKSSITNPQHVVMNKGLERQCFSTELRYPDPTMTIESTTKEAADSNPTPVIGALPFPYVGPWQFLDSTCANMAGDNAKVVAPPNCGGWNNVPPGVWGGFPWPLIPAMWAPFGNAWNMPWNPSTFLSSGGATAPSLGMPSSLATVPMQMDGIKSSHAGVSEPAQSLWVPKTLRIGDPVEAARSSIWTTLGLDDGPGLLDSGRGVTNAFQCKTGGKKDADFDESRTQSMHTNPAALSRSVTFNEKI